MTPEQEMLLRDTAKSVAAISDRMVHIEEKVDRLDDALFGIPEGSPPGEKSMIEALRIMWDAWKKGSWTVRIGTALFALLLSIGAALKMSADLWGGDK